MNRSYPVISIDIIQPEYIYLHSNTVLLNPRGDIQIIIYSIVYLDIYSPPKTVKLTLQSKYDIKTPNFNIINKRSVSSLKRRKITNLSKDSQKHICSILGNLIYLC